MSSQAGDDSNQSWDILEPRLVQHNLVGQDVTLDRGDTDIHCDDTVHILEMFGANFMIS